MRGYYQDVASASLNSVSNNSPELGVSLTYTGTYRSYDLDGVGNRVDVSADGVVESAYLLEGGDDSTNQYTFIDDAFQAYDPAGNLLDDGERQFAYGHRNQLLRAVKDSTDARYRHDVLGRRVSKRLSSGNFSGWSYGHSVYVHFGSDLIEEYDTSGNRRKEWIYGIRIDEPIRMKAPDYADLDDDENLTELVDLYYLTNSLGTVTALIDTSGNAVERYEYDVWGVILDVIDSDGSSTGASWTLVGNPWCYTGRQFEFEERTGLYHYRARDYRPEVGQFLQRDPLGVWGDAYVLGHVRTYTYMVPAQARVALWSPQQGGVGQTGADHPSLKAKRDCDESYRSCLERIWGRGDPTTAEDPALQAAERNCDRLLAECYGRLPQASAPKQPADSDVCDEYPEGYSYAFADARCFCKCAGDSEWSQAVRGCLIEAYRARWDAHEAHVFCYQVATSKYSIPFATLAECYAKCFCVQVNPVDPADPYDMGPMGDPWW